MYRQDPNASTSASAEHQFHLSASSTTSFQSSPFNYSPYGASGLLDPGLHQNSHYLSPSPLRKSPHQRQSSDGTMRPPTSSTSPRFSSSTLPKPSQISHTPTDRSLPNRQVTPDTITDAYVKFILYCNPKFPLDVDTATLSSNFQSPPKSDNKDFEIFRLYELIQKFDSKEIKTWGQLALDLGVERPDVSKGQSVQKVQQYSVRLKRWMRAMHVDAFFEYLNGKQHVYFTDIPDPSDPYPAAGRDGVQAEEDLAIRALDPTLRPKRGRRRNSEAELDEDSDTGPAPKQSRLMDGLQQYGTTPATAKMSPIPMSAHPGGLNDPWAAASAVTPHSFSHWGDKPADPQSTVTGTAPSHFRWQLHGASQDASTPHPMSAHPSSMASHIESAFENEPKSAITPSAKRKRKHGPAVSSAWPSANGPGAKPRGRPPASRNVQDGPFSTFPVDPANDKTNVTSNPAQDTMMQRQPSVEIQPPPSTLPPPQQRQSEGQARPGRLSLQVPERTGGPVRLATPPRVVVNGTADDGKSRPISPAVMHGNVPPIHAPSNRKIRNEGGFQILERDIPGFAFEALKRVLTSDLLRSELIGRAQRLTGEEAKSLADSVLERLNVPRPDTDESRDDIARLTAASWLGLGEQLRVPLGPAIGRNKKIQVTRFRVDEDGYEEIVSASDDTPAAHTREVFDLSWNVTMGGCNGSFELKGLTLGDSSQLPHREDPHDAILRMVADSARQAGMSDECVLRAVTHAERPEVRSHIDAVMAEDDGVDWKAKCAELMFGLKIAQGEFLRMRDRLVENVLDVIM